MKIKEKLFFVLLMLLSLGSHAQEVKVSGLIIDEETQAALPGANVMVKGTFLGTASRNDGSFELKMRSGSYILQVSYSGYQTTEVKVMAPASGLNIALKPVAYDIQNVVVTATKTERALSETPVITQVIPAKIIQQTAVPSVASLIELAVPGVEVAQADNGTSLKVQGLSPQYTLFLVDGNRIAGDTKGDIDYSRLNLVNIDHIEFVRGATSTLYGSNAIGGVFNIITRKPNTPFEATVLSRFGAYGDRNVGAYVGSKVGRLGIDGVYDYKSTNGYDLQPDVPGKTLEASNSHSYTQNVFYNLTPRLEISGKATYYTKKLDHSSPSSYDQRNNDFSYSGKLGWMLGKDGKLDASWLSDRYKTYNLIPQPNGSDDQSIQYDNRYYEARSQYSTSIGSFQKVVAGLDGVTEKLNSPRDSITNRSYSNMEAFIQDEVRLSYSLSLIAGGRFVHNSAFGNHATYQANLMYKISKFSFRGGFGTGYRTPGLKDLYIQYRIPSGYPLFIYGNPNLTPENSNYLNFSVEYSVAKFNTSLSAYRNNITNMISDQFVGVNNGVNDYTYANYGKVEVRGIDYLMSFRLNHSFGVSGGYSFIYSEDKSTGLQMFGTRKHSARLNFDYNFAKGYYSLNANLQVKYLGKMEQEYFDQATYQSYPIMLSDYFMANLAVSQTFYTQLTLTVGIDNLFDYTDKTHLSTYSPGRTFFVGLRYDFD
ncbi:MAG TPA: TonB-dependent receptor [Williamwhitmania sp.]|nr:TonB-dependent receptor [Williamwhitmania sp.]